MCPNVFCSEPVQKIWMYTAYLKVIITAYSPVSFCKCCNLWWHLYLLLSQWLWFLDKFCQGEKGISGPVPAPWGCSCITLRSGPSGLAGVKRAGQQDKVSGGSSSSQRSSRAAEAAPVAFWVLPLSKLFSLPSSAPSLVGVCTSKKWYGREQSLK